MILTILNPEVYNDDELKAVFEIDNVVEKLNCIVDWDSSKFPCTKELEEGSEEYEDNKANSIKFHKNILKGIVEKRIEDMKNPVIPLLSSSTTPSSMPRFTLSDGTDLELNDPSDVDKIPDNDLLRSIPESTYKFGEDREFLGETPRISSGTIFEVKDPDLRTILKVIDYNKVAVISGSGIDDFKEILDFEYNLKVNGEIYVDDYSKAKVSLVDSSEAQFSGIAGKICNFPIKYNLRKIISNNSKIKFLSKVFCAVVFGKDGSRNGIKLSVTTTFSVKPLTVYFSKYNISFCPEEIYETDGEELNEYIQMTIAILSASDKFEYDNEKEFDNIQSIIEERMKEEQEQEEERKSKTRGYRVNI